MQDALNVLELLVVRESAWHESLYLQLAILQFAKLKSDPSFLLRGLVGGGLGDAVVKGREVARELRARRRTGRLRGFRRLGLGSGKSGGRHFQDKSEKVRKERNPNTKLCNSCQKNDSKINWIIVKISRNANDCAFAP